MVERDIELKIKKLNPKAKLPKYGSEQAAGMDLFACLDKFEVINPNEFLSIPTGIAMELYPGFEAQVRGRSGMAFNRNVFAFHGTIDADYRGEIFVLLHNCSPAPVTIKDGDRIAQMIISPVIKFSPVEVTELSSTERGEGGKGSTGQ